MFTRSLLKTARSAGLLALASLASNHSLSNTYDQYISGSVRLQHSLFVESEEDRAINEESGTFQFAQISLYKRFRNNVFFQLSAEQSSQTLDYDGYTQGGTRYQTETEYYLRHYRAVLGRKKNRFSSYLGLVSRYRERNILTVTLANGGVLHGLYEELNSTDVLLGFDFYLFQSNRRHLKLVNEFSTSLKSDLHIDFDGAFDPADLRPGQTINWYVALEYFYDWTWGTGLSIRPFYQYSYMQSSNKIDLYQNNLKVGSSKQPTTEYQEAGIEFGLSKHF